MVRLVRASLRRLVPAALLVLALAATACSSTSDVAASSSAASSSAASSNAASSTTTSPGSAAAKSTSAPTGSFSVTSPVVGAGGRLPVEFTCDGASANPPVAWRGAPAGTVGYAVVMHHVAGPNDVHWYWVVYGLAATVDHLDANTTPPGQLGTNSVNDGAGYAPPCSQGPGDKTYTLTVYALARQPVFPDRTRVSRPVLLDAIAGQVLAQASIDVVYARPAGGAPPTTQPPRGGGPR
jgi:phosphatidylethanolamine-binding protein (PEBP) family uncharacterized protein